VLVARVDVLSSLLDKFSHAVTMEGNMPQGLTVSLDFNRLPINTQNPSLNPAAVRVGYDSDVNYTYMCAGPLV
jgi:hypothetical protein